MTHAQLQHAGAGATPDVVRFPDAASLRDRAASLLAGAGISGDFALVRLEGGANNRVYRVDAPRGPVVLKDYFHGDGERSDRLAAEFSFVSFAWEHGVRCVPRPLACDPSLGLALYEFVAGRKLALEEVDARAVGQAVEFYHALNKHKQSAAAATLPRATEACDTIAEHLDCVERRIERLLSVEPIAGIERDAAAFIRAELRAAWVRVARIARRDAVRHGLALDAPIGSGDRCISPSDFGFHNALVDATGRLCFIDFEYAGWDDPAKLVCDFFCQPAVPVSREYFDRFAEAIAAGLTDPDLGVRRFRLLLPVYQIKWCCILLNDFLPDGGRRRQFALPTSRQEERRQRQLLKARAALACVA